MSCQFEVLDPTAEITRAEGALSPRLDRLAGRTIGVLWNGRQGGDKVINRMLELLKERYAIGDVVFRRKPFFGNPPPREMYDELSSCDAVITGVGD